MPLIFSPFGGVVPKADPLALPEGAAQVAENCRVSSGTLEAFRNPLQVYAPTTPGLKTIYRLGQTTNSDTNYWLTFTKNVDVVKGAVAADVEERTYYTGDGYPKVTTAAMALTSRPYPATYYRLGLPAPAALPIATVHGAASSETAIAETRFYIYTFVSSMDEESAPSAPSNEVTFRDGQAVTLMLGNVPSGAYNVTRKRIYRTVTGSSSTAYLLVAEVPASSGAFEDTALAANLGEVCPSIEYLQLPDAARGLTAMPNGMMAAHTDYDVYFCVPHKPYAYPLSYMQTVDYPVVGLGSFGTSLLVLTTGTPYLMSGTDPSSISVEKLAVPYACLSKKSIVCAMGGVLFAASDGLVVVDHSGPKVLSDELFTRREWSALNPASMVCAVWDERIFVFYDNGVARGGYIFAGDGLTTTSVYATAAFTDPVTGSLFLCVDDKIVKWDAGLAGEFTWESRREQVPVPKNFAYGQVLAAAYPITVSIYADGALAHQQIVVDDKPFRLPSGFRARYWGLKLKGFARTFAAVIADTVGELQSV